jgi:H+/Cl- antiporter ClcA
LRRGDPTDGPPEGGRRTLGHRPERLPRLLAVAVVLGAFGGFVTVAFVRLLEWGQDRIWTDLPDALDVGSDEWYFIFPVVIVGAVLLGVARRRLGEYPVSIEQALTDHKRTGEFDRHHIWQAMVIALISLWFGAALGPEAALTAILGGICSWVARVIDADTGEGSDLSWVGIGSAMGALFGTAGAAVLTLDPRSSDAADARSGRLWRVIPALLAAWAGLWVYRWLGTSDHYFDLGLPDYTFRFGDLGWAVLVAVTAAAAGVVFLILRRLTDALLAPLAPRKVLSSVVGGLVLAALATWSSLVLFSGHEGTDDLIGAFGSDSVRFLVLVALAKLLAAAVLLSTGWKGGQFFPTMFAGAAIALAFSEGISGVDEVTALAAGMTGIVGVLLRRPLPAVLLMALFFPIAAWPAVLLGAVIGSTVGKRLERHLADE